MESVIELPVNVHLVDDPQDRFTTTRTDNEIPTMFNEINRIWTPAQIKFNPTIMPRERIDLNLLTELIDLPGNLTPLTNSNLIDAYFVNGVAINGLRSNGFARSELRRVFINDNTLVNDFRCVAHEFGHVLRLNHVFQAERLMAEGVNGEGLQDWEIEIARHMATMRN